MKVSQGGTTLSQSLSSWGIDNPQCVFRSLDDDEFTFDIRQSATVSPLLSYGALITLYKTSGGSTVAWFVGTITAVKTVGNYKTETVKYVCNGPWWQLKRLLYTQAAEQYSAGCGLTSSQITKIVLYQSPTTGGAITNGTMISNVLSFAEAAGVALAPGSILTGINLPLEETRDLTCADVIRRAMQWQPDGAAWFQYSTGVPVYYAQPRSGLTPTTINLSNDNLVESFSIWPRQDMVPAGVIFNYIGIAQCKVQVPNGCADPSTGIVNTSGATQTSASAVQVQTVTQDTGGLTTGPGILISSIDLTQLTPTSTEPAPTGLAALYYASLVTPSYDGTLTTKEYECSGTFRPGQAINITGGQSAWSSMLAQVQEVREVLYAGTTSINFGTPNHLAPQNFVTLIQMLRRRPLVTTGFAATNTPGTSNSTSCQQGIHPSTQKILNTLGGSPAASVTALNGAGTGGTGQNGFKGVLNTCQVAVCVGGTSTNMSFYCPPQ